MIIRQEKPEDYNEVYNVVQSAFASAEHSDGNEQDLVAALRKSEAFVEQLSLVALEDNRTVGYILFTEVKIGETTALALAPLAVLPEYQRRGIGTALIEHGHHIAAKLNYGCVVVLGSEKYYPKFGYQPAKKAGIVPPFDVPDKNFMMCRLSDEFEHVSGVVKYPKEFGI